MRHDWALFLHPDRLAQKAGAPVRHLRRMALKELADNAADVSEQVELEQLDAATYRVGDQGPGLNRERIAALFAVDRPLTSSKLLRRPTRGAVGNGLRVVTVLPSARAVNSVVESRGRCWRVEVDRTSGVTTTVDEGPSERISGTAVTVRFGPGLPPDAEPLPGRAPRPSSPVPPPGPCVRTRPGTSRRPGRSWCTPPRRHGKGPAGGVRRRERRRTAGPRADAGGSPGRRRGGARASAAADHRRCLPRRAREPAGPLPDGIPVLVQAWATCERVQGRGRSLVDVALLLNRTGVASEMRGGFDHEGAYLYGCRVYHQIPKVGRAAYVVRLAITAPHFPMVTERLEGLSPKENRDIPPLDYGRVYRLKTKKQNQFIGINGGLQSLDEAAQHLRHVDGAMLGRAAYHTPGILAEADSLIYGEQSVPVDFAGLIETMAAYAARHVEGGGRLAHVTRHMVGLFHGLPGARRYRQILSTDATRVGAGPEVLQAAFAAVEPRSGSEAA